ncbi:MAG TPA: hypothetical protein VII96_02465 [Acidimicrobiales bacterium]
MGETGAVSGISRVDRAIGAVLLLVLAALVGLGLVDSHSSAHAPLAGPATVASSPSVTAAPPTTAPPPPTTTTTTAPPTGPVSAVGDSILLDVQPELTADVPGISVDGLVSRQFEAGIAVVQADRAAGTLGKVLVVELGTNGAVTPADVDAMVQAAAGVTRIVFVNVCVPRAWTAPDNAVLVDGVARHADVAVLADWNALATPHPEWFTADRVHLNPAGATALAALIATLA